MNRKTDVELGMDRRITRRDFMHDTGIAALGMTFAGSVKGNTESEAQHSYPPTKTGLRGSHTGSYEIAHALRDGLALPQPTDLDETYDLIVVGGGISGLAAAHYYRKRFGHDSRILILENHDDFGGHARRNEFHQGGQMRLSMGGTHNLEHWKFSDTVNDLMRELGIHQGKLRDNMQYRYGYNARNGPSIWFDQDTYGSNRLVTNYTLQNWTPDQSLDCIDEFPLSSDAKKQLRELYTTRTNVLAEKSEDEARAYLSSISYVEFLKQHGGLDDEAIQIFHSAQHGGWGLELRALSAAEGLSVGLPGLNLLDATDMMEDRDYPVAMFPDGNASVARLLVQVLIPEVSPGTDVNNIAVAEFNYSKLDRPGSPTRLRLNATVVNARTEKDGVAVTYATGSNWSTIRGRHCVMACYHSILPHLLPELPNDQKEAQRFQVKMPLILANVLLSSSKHMDSLGIDQVHCPGRMLRNLFMFKGINNGGYSHRMEDDGPVPLVFWGSLTPPANAYTVKEQLRASRERMLELTLEDYEREIRTVLDGLLSPAGFDVAKDILAITVNRWPHGYSYEYLDLWDEDYDDGNWPHQVASRPFGPITFANSDAGASAYTHVAIDEAYRAVAELNRASL